MDNSRNLIGYGKNDLKITWPNNAKLAIQFVLNYEEGGENCVLNGDQYSEIYITIQFTIENLATSLKVLFAAHRPSTNDIKVMYKILGADESVDFQDLGFRYFNDDGSADVTVQPSADINDFQDYVYTAGVTDDGIGDPLPEFIAFQIKIIMQGTNTSTPPRLKDLRILALAT